MNLLNIQYDQFTTPNGLNVILYKDKSLPLVSVNIWYKVGSGNEREGKTGLAHLFEHMMFQGSENVPKEMHFRFIQEVGGSLNGSTNTDRTNYYEKVPSNYLELVLWLESDRMGYLVPSLTEEKLKNQLDVVRNERLERYENQPYGLAWEIISSNLYPKDHPYGWPTIGFMQDINYNLDEVKNFFTTYYSPSNANVVIAGDFNSSRIKDLVEKYFGEIPSTKVPEFIVSKNGALKENVILTRKENVQLGRIYFAWHTEPAFGKYDAHLEVLSDILSGSKNSRFYKNLVFEKELAQDVSAYQHSGKYGGSFMIAATARPGVELEILKEEILNELKNIESQSVTDKELLRSKNGIKSGFIHSLQNIDSLANQLNYYSFYLNEPNSFASDLKRYEEINPSFIQESAKKYLTKPFVELRILPEKND
ncbi:MAG TPA: pitrilysin family protein [Ignavibacteriaceae bacterium]|nr:pitrilysin family protein [Ignavibacteriaceae bacterium]